MRRLLALVLTAAAAAGCAGHARHVAPQSAPRKHGAPARAAARPEPARLVLRKTGTLEAPLQDAAAAAFDAHHAVLLGGLNAADVSTSGVRVVSRRVDRSVGSLPGALHDAAAMRIGGFVYLFGGGTGVSQLDTIQRIDPHTGATQTAGRLPAPSSDQAGAAIGDTAYIVGGYTGQRWLDTIVAWRPGTAARVVARLPVAVRYAAVAAAAGKLVIAGGSLPNGTASSTVLAFDPATRRFSRVGRLPSPTTHAAAAALGSDVYVVGGRGAARDTPTDRVVEVEPKGGGVRLVARLPFPVSDAAAVGLGKTILLAGGRSTAGPIAHIGVLVGARALPPAPKTAVPALVAATNVYAADAAGALSPVVRDDPPLVYVPNSDSNTVDVVDQRTFRIVGHFAVGALPQHVVPSYDLKTLYVTNDLGNSLTVVDPRTGKPGRTIPVDDPYNMYFTPDGRYAIVVAERLHRLDFRDAHTFRLHRSLSLPDCTGVDHMDFSADGSYLVASCEFAGRMIEVDVRRERLVGTITLRPGAMPQDVKLSPDGKLFYVADMRSDGVWEVTGKPFRKIGYLETGLGAHGLYPSRDARYLYVTNRDEGSISVISFRTRKVVAKWRIGGSPDMGGVSADGKVLWLTGRYNGALYAVSTQTGKLLATVAVGSGPHGACVWPQPGRYSLGHTGILR